tara:strand:- start:1149 stop:1367 length:219 start_codon:yes stop_codon:yes gene_type:complete
MYEVGQNIEISEWSYNAPADSRGEQGIIIDVSGSVGEDGNSYTVDFTEFGTMYLTEDDIKPLNNEDENGDLH